MTIHPPRSEQLTLANVHRDFSEWHLGRPRYFLWALDVDTPKVRQRLLAARNHLSGRLLDNYRRQAHVTVSLCGFPTLSPRREDEFSPDMLQHQVAVLAQLSLLPFDIELGGLHTFSSAPYLAVNDLEGYIAALHHGLSRLEVNRLDEDYIPHVTVGLYAGAWPMSDIAARLQSFDGGKRIPLRVNGLSLLAYQAAEIGGVLEEYARYDFKSGLSMREIF